MDRSSVHVHVSSSHRPVARANGVESGAPPPVLSLKITPDGWSTDSTFTLDWETPTWSEERDYIGALVEITDGTNDYEEYIEFPSGSVLKNYSFTVPEPGTFHSEIW